MKDAGEPMRSVIGRAIGRWDDSRELALVAPAACVIHEAVFLTRYISFLPPEYDAASVWLLVGCVAAILTCVFLRRRFPLAAMLAACACAAVSSPVDEGAYTGVPLLVLMYGLVARRDHLKAAASVLAVIAAFWVPVHLAGDENLALVHLEWILAVVVAALVSRALWTRRRADQELEDERTAREQIARERDEAEARSRIAGELHDSVGHDLTAIIALSEGLMGATGDETLDAAVASINDLARGPLRHPTCGPAALGPSRGCRGCGSLRPAYVGRHPARARARAFRRPCGRVHGDRFPVVRPCAGRAGFLRDA